PIRLERRITVGPALRGSLLTLLRFFIGEHERRSGLTLHRRQRREIVGALQIRMPVLQARDRVLRLTRQRRYRDHHRGRSDADHKTFHFSCSLCQFLSERFQAAFVSRPFRAATWNDLTVVSCEFNFETRSYSDPSFRFPHSAFCIG